MAFHSLASSPKTALLTLIAFTLLLPPTVWADSFEAQLMNAQPTSVTTRAIATGETTTTLTTDSYSLAATTATTLWEVTVDGLSLQPNRFLKTSSSPRFLARPIPKTNQLVIEFPNAELRASLPPKALAGNVNQNGIQSVSISQHKGSLVSSVRVVILYAPSVSIEKLRPTKTPTQSLLVPFPMIASSNTSHKTAGTITGTSVVPYKLGKAPAEEPSDTENATSVLATALADEPKVSLKGLEIEAEFLLLKPAEGAGLLKVKNQFYLEKPNRFVVDLEPATLSGDLFTSEGPPTGKAPTSGVTQWNGWTVRLSQNTPSIVRLVIETEGNKNFKLLEGSAQAPLAFRNALVVQPTTGVKRPVKDASSSLPASAAKGNLTQVYFSPPTSKGTVKMRLEASVPLEYRISNETAQSLVLSLPNIAPPENGGVQSFDVKSFPYLKRLSHVAAAKGSSLLIEFSQPVKDLRSLPYTAQRALELSFLVSSSPTAIGSSIRNPKGRIVIDAGHGGKDQGTSRAGVLEKDLNLACTTFLVEALKRRGLEVYTTRTTDKFLELREISAIANKYDPDLFVSVHHNSSTDASIAGLETYYYHYPSIALAKAVHAALVGALPVKDRGVRRAQFYVINHTTAPSILVEMGYVSNAGERAEVNSTARQRKSAEAIADGIVEYLRQLRR